MGGLTNENNEKKVFLSIVGGKFAKRATEGAEGATEREIEYPKGTKKMIWEITYSSLEAMIDSVKLKEGEKFGDQLQINMSYVGENFTVTLPVASREGKAFMMCLPNINLAAEVTLQPYNYFRKSDQKHMQGLGVVQGKDGDGKGLKVPYSYMEEPTFPKVAEGSDKDEFMLAMKSQEVWLKKKTKLFIAKHFTGTTTATIHRVEAGRVTPNIAESKKAAEPIGYVDNPDDGQDLPF